jgi:hypothetical protein
LGASEELNPFLAVMPGLGPDIHVFFRSNNANNKG